MKSVTVFQHLPTLPTKGLSRAMNDFTTPTKTCPKCKLEKPLTSDFWHRNKNHSTGLDGICSDCRNEAQRKRYNPVYQQEYYQDNKEHLRSLNKKNAEKRTSRKSKRQRYRERLFRLTSLPGDMTEQDWQSALSYFNGCCAICGEQMADLFGTRIAAIDHWIPIDSKDCPGTIVTNIVPLCHGDNGCNNKKRSMHPERYLTQYYSPKEAQQILDRIHTYFEWARKRKYGI